MFVSIFMQMWLDT